MAFLLSENPLLAPDGSPILTNECPEQKEDALVEDFPPAAFVRQRRMKRVARCFFAVGVLTVSLPLIAGLFNQNIALPIGVIVADLMMIGVVIQARSDPIFARRSVDQEDPA